MRECVREIHNLYKSVCVFIRSLTKYTFTTINFCDKHSDGENLTKTKIYLWFNKT